jgi:predicted metal-dependent phosphoesterase TrpH
MDRGFSHGTADIHVHTRYSDGRPTVGQVLEHASANTALDLIAITDHDTIDGAMEAAALVSSHRVAVIVGEEVTSRDGHILGLFLTESVQPGLSGREAIAAIHAQGGVAIAAHPFVPGDDYIAGIGTVPMGAGAVLSDMPFDGVEVRNSFPAFAWFNRRARAAQRGTRLAATGGSDAHVVEAVGKAFTRFPGRTPADLAAAIREGRTAAGGSAYGPRSGFAYATYILDPQRIHSIYQARRARRR